MNQPFFVHLTDPVPVRSVFNTVALKVFCVVRHAQRRVSQAPVHVRSVVQDVANAWRESDHIVPNE
jgi:hypothetical protein